MRIQHKNLTIRQAEVADAKQLAAWWNDGAVMAHAGFPNGLGTTEEEVVKGLRNGLLVVEESDRLIGECNYHNVSDGVVEIGIKICETDCQNRGVGRKVLSMLIGWLFRNGYAKIILDTNLTNTRAQHVYESLRFLYKGIIIKHNKTEPTYTKTSLFLCEKRRFFMARTEKGVVATI